LAAKRKWAALNVINKLLSIEFVKSRQLIDKFLDKNPEVSTRGKKDFTNLRVKIWNHFIYSKLIYKISFLERSFFETSFFWKKEELYK